ncbi:OmpA family protein [Capnocytophaga cynodegmi]|uniref:OmpA family protein n=1 Tax=Capnocytophaga cynodegmi TaxID=28189 RepID=UPI00385E98AC
MKKHIFALASLIFVGAQAQENYNKWSVDLNGGINKPIAPFSAQYSTSTPSLWGANAGVRYMFNNKFGLRLGGGYDSFEEGDKSNKFESSFWNVNLQGVANVGRVLSFEEWTSDLGLLAHAGVGYGQLNSKALSSADQVAFIVAGLTPQLRISNRVTLLADASIFFNARQQRTFDTFSESDRRGIQGVNVAATIGLQVALGKHGKHADWHHEGSKFEKIEERLASLEGDVSGLQQEVANKQNKMNDANGNGVPDEVESYVNDNYATKESVKSLIEDGGDMAADLIRKGYISTYFDFNSSKPQVSSTWAVDFVSKFLKSNSGANINIVGFADELGGTNYNQSLSNKRAEAVKKLLIDAGVDASRISTEGRGEDTSVNKTSPRARQIARRATFELK